MAESTRKNKRKNVRRKSAKQQSFWRERLAKCWRFTKLMAAAVSVATLLGVSGFYGNKLVEQFLNRPIASVTVKGEFAYLQKAELATLISDSIGNTFIKENLNTMKLRLQEHPWVGGVTLSRQWPDILTVSIVEEKPIARWGDRGFINYRGDIIEVALDGQLDHLPKLAAEDEQAVLVMKQYQFLSQTLLPYELEITELVRDPRGLWEIHLSTGWKIMAGRSEIVKKVQQLMQLIASRQIEYQQYIDTIDLRYDNGLAIKWHRIEQDNQLSHAHNI